MPVDAEGAIFLHERIKADTFGRAVSPLQTPPWPTADIEYALTIVVLASKAEFSSIKPLVMVAAELALGVMTLCPVAELHHPF